MVTSKTRVYLGALFGSALLAAVSGVVYGGFGFGVTVFVIASIGTCVGIWVLTRFG